MSAPRFSTDVHPLTDLKLHASALVNQAVRERRPVLLTRRGRGVAVLLDLTEYERLADTASFVAAVREGAAAAGAGDLHPHAKALEILDTLG